ncbi:hypothetical protein [Calothrix sp. 336/3]|nr:hypothetical protein [Calothrix sp. 336/3]
MNLLECQAVARGPVSAPGILKALILRIVLLGVLKSETKQIMKLALECNG